MDRAEATRLLELSRRAEWSFPTSYSNSRLVRAGTDQWVPDLAAQQDAFDAAAQFLVEERDEAAAELAANVWRLWMMAGDIGGARAFLAPVVNTSSSTASRYRAQALYGDALLAIKQGAREASRERAQAALDVATMAADPEGQVLGLLGLSRVAFDEGDYEAARSLAAGARERAQGLDLAMQQAPLHMLAQSRRLLGDDDGAAALFAESLELNRQLGDEGMVYVELHNLGHAEAHRGHVAAAERCFAEAAERLDRNDPYDVALGELNRAVLAFLHGERTRAVELLRGVEEELEKSGIDLVTEDRFELERLARQLAAEQ